MEYGLNVTLDDGATLEQVAEAFEAAAESAADALRASRAHVKVDGQIALDADVDGLQDASLNRYC